MRLASTLLKYALGIVAFAVVVAIFFPTGNRGRPNARRSSCQSNLKQIGLAVQQYIQDYDGTLPSNKITTSQGWVDSLQPYSKSWPIFQCAENRNKRQNLTDYFYNAQLSEAKVKNVSFPAVTILAGDGNYDAPLNTAIAALPQGWRDYKESPAYRHLDGANYAFADGHVKWFKPEKVTLETPKQDGVYTFLPR